VSAATSPGGRGRLVAGLGETPCPPTGVALAGALAERDRRSAETASLLGSGARAVVRLSARMPSRMRERGLCESPIERGAAAFESACRGLGVRVEGRGAGDGALGPWRLWASDASPAELKRAALIVEEGSYLGQLLDIDVAGQDGAFGRSELCMPPRPCVVCGRPASACAGRAAHPERDVEDAFEAILGLSSGALAAPGREIGSPDGGAVGDYPSSTIREIAYKGGDTP